VHREVFDAKGNDIRNGDTVIFNRSGDVEVGIVKKIWDAVKKKKCQRKADILDLSLLPVKTKIRIMRKGGGLSAIENPKSIMVIARKGEEYCLMDHLQVEGCCDDRD
jgi:hypothetical protein